MNTATDTTPRQKLEAFMAEHKLTIDAVFVPLSHSRNAGGKWRSLNWRVTLKRDGREVLTTDYSAGEAHAPAYSWKADNKSGIPRHIRDAAIADECEQGVAMSKPFGSFVEHKAHATRKRIDPDVVSVFWSMLQDSDVIDAGGFEDWASNFGYDTDSRKAEATYRACLDNALKLRAALGDVVLNAGREAAQDF
jgi:hypothetical protein